MRDRGPTPPPAAGGDAAHDGMAPRIRRALGLLAKVAIALLIAEATLRLLAPGVNISPYWRYHPTLGWTQVPGLDTEIHPRGRENPAVRVRFNSLGFRDGEHPVAKPPGTRRVVVVGDSFSEAIQVELRDTWHQVLEARLDAASTAKWEAINLGVGDFGTAQALLALEEYGWGYAPDVVVCQVFPLNDIGNNSIELAGLCKSRNDGYRPYAVEVRLPVGPVEWASSQPIRRSLRRYWKCFGLVENLATRLADAVFEPYADSGRHALLAAHGYTGLDPLLQTYAPADRQAAAVARGWQLTEELLACMHHRCRARGVAFLVLVVPFAGRLAPEWAEFAKTRPGMQRTYPEERIGALCRSLGCPAVMMLPDFDAHPQEVLPYIDGHFNEAGHRRTGSAVFAAIATAGWLEPKKR